MDSQALIAYEIFVAGVLVETAIGGADTIVCCQVRTEHDVYPLVDKAGLTWGRP